MSIAMNDFALRHTVDSPHSHYIGSFDGLCKLLEVNIEKLVIIDDSGVAKITLTCGGFFSGVTELTENSVISGAYQARRDCEHPFITNATKIGAVKAPAVETDVILYSKDKLLASCENSSDADWEVVSINSKPFEGMEPMHPVTMARNMAGIAGGSKTEYTAHQFILSIFHWFGGDGKPTYVKIEA